MKKAPSQFSYHKVIGNRSKEEHEKLYTICAGNTKREVVSNNFFLKMSCLISGCFRTL